MFNSRKIEVMFVKLLLTLTALLTIHHPVNAQGFVTDGTPQLNDSHCVGSTDQRLACLIARRPECYGHQMSDEETMYCWAPALNLYPWDPVVMLHILQCESHGLTTATNGRYKGLLQENYGSYDPIQNIRTAYNWFYLNQGYRAWSTYGMRC